MLIWHPTCCPSRVPRDRCELEAKLVRVNLVEYSNQVQWSTVFYSTSRQCAAWVQHDTTAAPCTQLPLRGLRTLDAWPTGPRTMHTHIFFLWIHPNRERWKGEYMSYIRRNNSKVTMSFSSIANKTGPTRASGSFSITFPPHPSSDRKLSSCVSGWYFLRVPGCRTATPIQIFVHRFICARDTGMSRRLSNMALSSMWNSLCTIIVKVTGFVTSSLTRSLGDRMRSFPTLSVVSAF